MLYDATVMLYICTPPPPFPWPFVGDDKKCKKQDALGKASGCNRGHGCCREGLAGAPVLGSRLGHLPCVRRGQGATRDRAAPGLEIAACLPLPPHRAPSPTARRLSAFGGGVLTCPATLPLRTGSPRCCSVSPGLKMVPQSVCTITGAVPRQSEDKVWVFPCCGGLPGQGRGCLFAFF